MSVLVEDRGAIAIVEFKHTAQKCGWCKNDVLGKMALFTHDTKVTVTYLCQACALDFTTRLATKVALGLNGHTTIPDLSATPPDVMRGIKERATRLGMTIPDKNATPSRNGKKKRSYKWVNSLPRGENHARAKLTEAKVRQIKWALKHDNASCRDLAKQHGVGYQAIYAIKRGFTWAHLAVS
jgi:hypothetical protein